MFRLRGIDLHHLRLHGFTRLSGRMRLDASEYLFAMRLFWRLLKILNKTMKKTPKSYEAASPMDSVFQKSECETVFKNIIVILARTGNKWRELSWKDYKAEREKDGDFSNYEKEFFEKVIDYAHPERIGLFAKGYNRISRNLPQESFSPTVQESGVD